MRIAIVGSRTFEDYDFMEQKLDQLFLNIGKPEKIISGGALGADTLAQMYADIHHIPFEEHRPEWKRYGQRAGFVRNQIIVGNSDYVIAFWDGESKGTAHTILTAIGSGITVYCPWKGEEIVDGWRKQHRAENPV
jgi:predicted Rossmann fold nucleotide-binding protein DprA/Smf involved in DNA uptake